MNKGWTRDEPTEEPPDEVNLWDLVPFVVGAWAVGYFGVTWFVLWR